MNTFIDTSKSVIPTIPSVHGTSILGVVNQKFFLPVLLVSLIFEKVQCLSTFLGVC